MPLTVACFCGNVYRVLYGPPVCPFCCEPVPARVREEIERLGDGGSSEDWTPED